MRPLVFLLAIALLAPLLASAAESPRRFPTPAADRAWAPDLQRADSLLWAYRAADAAREAIAIRDRARAARAEWPEMSASVLAAAADGLLGRGPEAEAHALDGVRIARRLRDREYERRAARWLAFAFETQGRSAAAESTYRALLRAATPARDTLHMGAAHLGIGYASLNRGALAAARRNYQRALPLLDRARNPVLVATARVGLARTLHELGEFEDEKRIYLEVLGQARRANLGRNEVDALNNLGSVAYSQGDIVSAAAHWRLALAKQRSLQSQEAAPSIVGNLTMALTDLGRLDEADAVLDSALGVAQRAGSREAIAVLENRRGETSLLREHRGEALQAFLRAERSVPEGYRLLLAQVRIGILRARATTEPAQATLDYATREVQPLLAALGEDQRAEMQMRIGDVLLAAGRVREAAGVFEGLTAARAHGADRSRRAVALYRQGCALRRLGLADSARVTLARSVAAWEEWRTLTRGARWQELATFPFSHLPVEYADALLEGGDATPRRLARAWDVLQAGRSRAVLDRLTGGAPAVRDAATLSLARTQAMLLAPGDLLLDFHAGEHVTLLFVVTRASVRLVRLPAADSLRAPLAAWYGLLAAAPDGGAPARTLEATRDRLAERLLGGVARELRASRRVILSLDGPTSLAPIEELARHMLAGASGEAARLELMRVPSVSVLATLRARPRTREAVRVLAWRGASDASHPVLRGAAGEVAHLQRRIAGTQVREGDRARALPTQAELAPWGVLHFAAHARSLGQSPWESGLLCADSLRSGGSPWLTARQITPMRLNARLVFLSGCSTASGRAQGGEGVMGLTSAFQSAGVPSVVATLWAVDDAATSRLVEVFYERLLAGDSVAAALEAGRSALRAGRDTAHPHYWAGFVLSGDGAQRISLRPRSLGRF